MIADWHSRPLAALDGSPAAIPEIWLALAACLILLIDVYFGAERAAA